MGERNELLVECERCGVGIDTNNMTMDPKGCSVVIDAQTALIALTTLQETSGPNVLPMEQRLLAIKYLKDALEEVM